MAAATVIFDNTPKVERVPLKCRRAGAGEGVRRGFPALARIRGGQVVTADATLRRVVDRLGLVLDPVEAF